VGWGGYQLLVEMKRCGRVGVQCWVLQCEARIMECQEKGWKWRSPAPSIHTQMFCLKSSQLKFGKQNSSRVHLFIFLDILLHGTKESIGQSVDLVQEQ
jgi:hypothetical protein